MWENREFRIRFEENTVMEFEKVVLSSGDCNLFIPMGFMGDDKGETVMYNCSGFAPLRSYRIASIQEALYIMERVAVILEKAVGYLISPTKITLTLDTVFYNGETGEIKIAYVPILGYETTLRKNMVRFIGMLMKNIRESDKEKLVEIAKYIYCKNYSMQDIINKIGLAIKG
ncbi:MAG: hypothetical protein GX663_02910 [Clostridiales bacterium]|nr:hypothetical protein [Clostridiales bacterium]